VAARSKAWVCGYSLGGIAGSNPAVSMDACCECYVLSLRQADPTYRGNPPSVCVCVCVTQCNSNPLHLQCVGRRDQTKKEETKERRKKESLGVFPYVSYHMWYASTEKFSQQNTFLTINVYYSPTNAQWIINFDSIKMQSTNVQITKNKIFLIVWPLQMDTTGCPETSVTDH
jgi:hypothetical protein